MATDQLGKRLSMLTRPRRSLQFRDMSAAEIRHWIDASEASEHCDRRDVHAARVVLRWRIWQSYSSAWPI